jgi:predicted glycosyltransferase
MTKKRVLVAPLDWGLGHATRCVPVIRELIRQDAEVILAADGRPYEFLEKEFPDLRLIRFPGYDITYPKHRFMGLHFALRSPVLLKKIKEERRRISEIVTEHGIEVIISDNRLACRTSRTYNIYITHQLSLKAPFAAQWLSKKHHDYYDKFDEVWVPDADTKRNLSGDLGHSDGNNPFVRYTGPLTRFEDPGPWNSRPMKWWMVVMLSGPEPQRSIFERIVLDELSKFTEDTLVIRGIPGDEPLPQHALPHVTIVNHLNDEELKEALLSTHNVLCRPGYSTLCDLSTLGLSPIVVPTPGQSEQEYLAAYHEEQQHLVNAKQKNFNLGEALRRKFQMLPFGVVPDAEMLARRVRSALK